MKSRTSRVCRLISPRAPSRSTCRTPPGRNCSGSCHRSCPHASTRRRHRRSRPSSLSRRRRQRLPRFRRPTGGGSSGRSSSALHPCLRAERRWAPKRRPSTRGRTKSAPSSDSTRAGHRSSLIADEVGLGKTIQAGLLLRQAWLAGRAKRILILAPKAVLKQWQIELREKFNLNWPIYDEGRLVRYPARALRGNHERNVDAKRWHEEPVVLASSQLMRRKERAAVLLDEARSSMNVFVVAPLGLVAILVVVGFRWMPGRCCSPAGRSVLRCSARRPFGSRLAEAHCSRRVTRALPLAGALDGRAAPCVMGTRRVGSCSWRPSRRSVVPGRGPVGSLRGVSSLRGGTPIGVFGFSMPGYSTSCGSRCWWSRSGRSDRLRGVVACRFEALAPGGALLASEGGSRGR